MADTLVDATVQTNLNYRTLRLGPVWIDENTAYVVYTDDALDLVYQKTGDGGATWGAPVLIRVGTVIKTSIWFDKWTPGDAGTKIHIAYMDSTSDDVFYRSLNTSGDSLGSEITVFAGVSFNVGGNWTGAIVDITKARGGNLYIGFWGDAVGEFGFYRSDDAGATWNSRAQLADGNAVDPILLFPGNEADTQDIWCIYWDVDASEISLKIYDNSGDSWSETAIVGSMTFNSQLFPMSGATRASDNHVILAAWTVYNNAAADLVVWDIGGSGSLTAKTDVVTNLDDSALVAVFIDQQTDDIYVAYITGAVFPGTVDIKYKKSADGGASWGAQQDYSELAADNLRMVWAGMSVGTDGGKFQPAWFNDDLDDLYVNLVNDVHIAPSVNPLRDAYVGASVDDIPNQGSARS